MSVVSELMFSAPFGAGACLNLSWHTRNCCVLDAHYVKEFRTRVLSHQDDLLTSEAAVILV